MGNLIKALMQMFCGVSVKNFENRSIFGEGMDQILQHTFLAHSGRSTQMYTLR